jgi:hypothetical protein
VRIRRLSEIDLARLAAIVDQAELEHNLRRYNVGGGSWSYDPVRVSTSELVGAATPLLGFLPKITWEQVEKQIRSACTRGQSQVDANLLVGRVLFLAARRLDWSAVKFEMSSMPIGSGEAVKYWNDVVVEQEGRLLVPFFDHRRSGGVANAAIRQIVFSMQNIWIRGRYPDLAEATLAVVRFPPDGSSRSIDIHMHNEADLLTYEELDARVRNVYTTWNVISTEKARTEGRKTGTGGGSLF